MLIRLGIDHQSLKAVYIYMCFNTAVELTKIPLLVCSAHRLKFYVPTDILLCVPKML